MPLTHLTFQAEPQSPSLLPAALSLSLLLELSIHLAFHCSNSRLPFFKHLSFSPFSLILCTDILCCCCCCLVSLNIHQVSFSQHELLSVLEKGCIAFQAPGGHKPESNHSVLVVQKESPFASFIFFWVAPSGAAVCFQMIELGM